MDEHELMRELGDVLDRLSSLPDDALAERWALRGRQQELRDELAVLQAPARADMADEWAEQAARKTPERTKPPIPILPGDSSAQGM